LAKWTEIEFGDALAMATNPVYPGRKAAKSLLNVHTHQRPGAMTLRPGYELKYEEPVNGRITNPSVLNFDFFFDRQAESQGREITVLLQKGTVVSLSGSDVSHTQNMLCVWARPYWNGMTWVDEWQWLNETIITKIVTASDATYKNVIEIYDGLAIADDTLIGYTIHNKTRGQTAKIITNKIAIPGTTRINHTLFNNDWSVYDVIVISKAWLEPEVLEALFNTGWEHITFHRVLNDLRIGFGGYENKPGLAVGYRKSYYLIKDIDFTAVHSDITEEAVEKFSTINGIVLNTHILNSNQAGIELTTDTGTLEKKTYYFKLTGVMDNYAEQLIATANIDVDGTQDITVKPYLDMGKINSRITSIKLYISNDNLNFYLIREDIVASTIREFLSLNLDNNGRLNNGVSSIEGNGEFHRDANAANITNEANSIGQWSNKGGNDTHIYSFQVFLRHDTSYIYPPDGEHYLHWESGYTVVPMLIFSPTITAAKKRLQISFKIITTRNITLRVSSGSPFIPNPFGDDREYKDIQVNNLMNWETHTFELDIQGSLSFGIVSGNTSGIRIGIDGLTVNISNPGTPQLGPEISDEMGYTPTFNMVKGWDQALLFRGRAYYLNPFIEKRYENFIVVSHIAPPGTYMYDMASFANFRELEKFDSNKAIAMALLPTIELLILKDKSINAIDPDTGASREPVFGIGCISRNTVVNMNGIIYWADEDDIYVMNIGGGFTPKPILEQTIRDIYQALTNKEWLFAVRDKYNTYRLRTYDETNKREFLFTKNGPIEENKYLYPEIYRIGAGGILNFLSKGNIYRLDPELAGVITDDLGEYLVDDEETYITDK